MIQYLQILLNTHRNEERGASAVEYGLLVALIAAVIVTAVALIGTNLTTLFTGVAGDL
jgi:pilus assembly protein Flp/PilA